MVTTEPNATPTNSPYRGLEAHLTSSGLTPEDLIHMLELAANAVEAWDAIASPVRAHIRKAAPRLAATLDALSTENR